MIFSRNFAEHSKKYWEDVLTFSEFLKNCENFPEFWQNFERILMCKDSNDSVARQSVHLSTQVLLLLCLRGRARRRSLHLPEGWQGRARLRQLPHTRLGDGVPQWLPEPGHDPALFRRLVLGWIDADFRVQIRILQHFSKSTRKSSSREQILQISAKKFFFLFWKFSQIVL